MFFLCPQGDLVAVGVLSGNRNFEGRVHPNTRANYLTSPPLVIAYAIAGTVRIDFETEPLGKRYCLFYFFYIPFNCTSLELCFAVYILFRLFTRKNLYKTTVHVQIYFE